MPPGITAEFRHPPVATQFLTVAEAAGLGEGMRLTFSKGMPGLWPLVMRNVLHFKRIPCVLVNHPNSPGRQDELYRLTAQRSAPVMWWGAERPRSAWTEQMYLAERVGSGPPLFPGSRAERVQMFGLLHEILEGESMGFLHYMRLVMSAKLGPEGGPFAVKYGYTKERQREAPQKVVEFLQYIDETLRQQHERGSPYLVGGAASAADICWATLALLFDPGDLVQRTREGQRLLGAWKAAFAFVPPAAFTPRMRAHRARVLAECAERPATDLGGTPPSKL